MINRKKIYNPNSQESVNERKIFGGNPTSIFELNKIKYQWAYNLWKVMLANTWFPEEVNMTLDKRDYANDLTPEEKILFSSSFTDAPNSRLSDKLINPIFIRSPFFIHLKNLQCRLCL